MYQLEERKIALFSVQLVIISLCFGGFYLNIGFALKPFIILSFLNILLLFSIMRFNRLLTFETILIFFLIVYCASALQFNYSAEHLRFILAIVIILLFYFSTRGLIILISIKNLQKIISISGIIGTSASLLYYLIGLMEIGTNFHGNGIINYGLMLDRSIPRMIGTASGDPNIFVFFITLYFFFFLYNISTTSNKIGFLLTTICIVLTFSRGAYISIIITSLLVFILAVKQKGKLKNTFIIILLLLGISQSLTFFGINYFGFIENRFSNISNDGGSGRIVLWMNAIETFKNNPIMGIGLNGTLKYNEVHYGNAVYIHNTMLEVLSETGLIGFIIFIFLWTSIFITSINLYKKNKSTKFLLATFVAIFIQMLSLSILLNEAFYLILLILYRYKVENVNFLDTYKRGFRN